MSSLNYCLKKFGQNLSQYDIDKIKEYVEGHERDNLPTVFANHEAIRDYIADLENEYSGYVAQVSKQLDKSITPETKLEKPIAPTEKVNGITRETMGRRIARGDESVLEDIQEGIEKHGLRKMQDAVRNQIGREVLKAKKGEERKTVRAKIAELEPRIDRLLEGKKLPEKAVSEEEKLAIDRKAYAEYQKKKAGLAKPKKEPIPKKEIEKGKGIFFKLYGAGPQKFEMIRNLLREEADLQEERYYAVRNVKTGEIQTVEEIDLKPIGENAKIWLSKPKFAKESVSPAAPKSTIAQVENYIQQSIGTKKAASLIDSGKVVIVETGAELMDKVGATEIEIDAQRDLMGYVLGAYHNGTTYLVAKNLSESTTYSTLLHEMFHAERSENGWKGIFGKNHENIKSQYEKLIKLKHAGLIKAQEKARNAGTPETELFEETLTYYLQDKANHKTTLFKRILSAIRAWAIRSGLKKTVKAEDLVDIAQAALKRQAKGIPARGLKTTTPMLAQRKSPEWYSRLGRLVKDFDVEKQSASAWIATFNSWKKKKLPPALQEELGWSGLLESLELMGERKITKDQIQDMIEVGGVQVEEKILDSTVEPLKWKSGMKYTVSNIGGYRIEHVPNGTFNLMKIGTGLTENFEVLTEAKEKANSYYKREAPTDVGYPASVLPGGKNYKEILISLPAQKPTDRIGILWDKIQKDTATQAERIEYNSRIKTDKFDKKEDFIPTHFADTPNLLVHIRVDERIDAEGHKTLFVNEVQSDYSAEARKRGIKRKKGYIPTDKEVRQFFDLNPEADPADYRDEMIEHPDFLRGAPDAPFIKSDTAWSMLGIKKAIRYAATNGFDKIAWPSTPEQVYEIEGWGGVIEEDGRYKNQDGTGDVTAIVTRYLKDLPRNVNRFLKSQIKTDVTVEQDMLGAETVNSVDISSFTEQVRREGVPLFAKEAMVGALPIPEKTSSFVLDKITALQEKADPKWQDRIERLIQYWIDRDDPTRRVQDRYGKQKEETDYLAAERARGKVTVAETKRFREDEVTPLLKELADKNLEASDLGEYAYAKHVPEANKKLRQVNANRYVKNIIQQKTGKEKEELQYDFDNAAANVGIQEKQNEFLEILEREFAGLPEIKGFLDGRKSELDNRVWTAEEENKGTPERLYGYLKETEKRYERLVKQKADWDLRSPRFSGITDVEANSIVDKWNKDKRDIEPARKMLAKINQGRLQNLFDGGELTKTEFDDLTFSYEFYVPLNRIGFDGRPVAGRATGPLGKPLKTRAGSLRKVDMPKILANSIANRQAAISRKNKLQATEKLHELIQDNPDLSMTIEDMPKQPDYDSSGNIQYYPNLQEPENGIFIKIKGKKKLISVVNPDDQTAMRMITGIKETDVGTGPVINMIGKVTRIMAALNTSLSPEFMFTNFPRDIQTAMINIEDTEAAGMQKAILKGVPGAIRAIWRTERGKDAGEYGKTYKEFEDNGGKIGWMQGYDTIEDLAKNLTNEMKVYQKRHVSQKVIHSMKILTVAANSAVENGVRLAAYKQLVKAGISKKRAAAVASNMTVDFTRGGTGKTAFNALFMFANAGIQGNLRMIKAIKRSPKVRQIVTGIIGTGLVLNLLATAMGGEDDDGIAYYDKLDDSLKERNMIFMVPGKGETPLRVPMPWGYNVFFNIGDELADMFKQGADYSPAKGAQRIASVMMGAFNPLGSATLLQTITPTIGDPIAMVAENKTWFGGPLMPEGYGRDRPDSELYWESVNPALKSVAKTLNKLTYGDTVKPGMIDVSPETLELLFDTAGGSAGRFVKDVLFLPVKIKTGELEMRDVPVIRKFVTQKSEWTDAKIYRERKDEILQLADRYKAAKTLDKKRTLKAMKDYKFITRTRLIDKKIRKLNKTREDYELRGIDTETVEASIKRLRDSYLRTVGQGAR